MALVINTNLSSIAAQNNLARASERLQSSVERLSSGLRITRGADDPAGLAVSEIMRGKILASAVAMRNANDGVSLLQTAEGAVGEINNILIRMRELATQAASPSLGSSERTLLNNEFLQLKSEIDRIAQVTEFNGQILVNGALSASGNMTVQIGIGTGSNNTLALQISGTTTAALSVGSQTLSDVSAASSAITMVESAISNAVGVRGQVGAFQSRLTSAIANLRVGSENLQAAASRIRDADFGYETAVFTKNQILLQSSTAVLAQANLLPQAALTLLR